MNKLLFFVAAFVAVSLPAYAKLYWLPDYQFFNMKEGGRKYSPNSNRTATCSDGGYYNGVLGNDYNCAGVIYAHRVCYACTPKPCPNGYSTSVRSPCTPKEGYTEKFLSSGTSGGKVCGQCTYSEKSCAEGYEAGLESCGGSGWIYSTQGKSGEKICGKCEKKACPAGFTAGVLKCSGNGYTYQSNGYSGAEKCGKCDLKDCPAGYDYTVTTCGDGYNFVTNGYHGTQTCGKCRPVFICDNSFIRRTSLFDGRANTKAMIDEIGTDALAATACNQFYAPGVDKNDANFGQGQWYLPAIGELMELYGFNAKGITSETETSGVTGNNKNEVNNALSAIKNADGKATTLTEGYYWSSSEYNNNESWQLIMSNGHRPNNIEASNSYVRSFLYLENKFNPVDVVSLPNIGDVMYSDLTYGSADDYDSSKTAVGIIVWYSEDGKSAKIVSLKDLTFSSFNTAGGFNPDDPYAGSVGYTYHTTSAKYNEDATDVDNYDRNMFLAAFKKVIEENCED